MAFTETGLRLKVSSKRMEFSQKLILEKSIILKEEEVDQENPLHQISFQLINQLITNTME